MPGSEKNREVGVRTFVLPPLLTQHALPANIEAARRPGRPDGGVVQEFDAEDPE